MDHTLHTDKILQVADFFIQKSQKDTEKGLDSKKLQKLLYYSQAWNLVVNNKKIFEDDFQAWVHGPANLKVWHEFKTFNFSRSHPEFLKLEFNFSEEEISVLESVWNVYGKFDGDYLETLTHNEDPWLEARRGLNPEDISKNVISIESMKSYYERRLQETTRSN